MSNIEALKVLIELSETDKKSERARRGEALQVILDALMDYERIKS